MRGFALIEALVAVLLFAIGIVALLRVLGTAVKDAGEVEYRAVAATLADATIGRMWVDRANLGPPTKSSTTRCRSCRTACRRSTSPATS